MKQLITTAPPNEESKVGKENAIKIARGGWEEIPQGSGSVDFVGLMCMKLSKHQHEAKITSLEAENQRLREAMYERDVGVKNSEMTASIEVKTMKKTITELRLSLSSKESELEAIKKQLSAANSEKDRLNIDLMSRKEVWADTDCLKC